MSCYARNPIGYTKTGIPIFSSEDVYTRNYERISEDHLAVERESGKNPFMSDAMRISLETSTQELIRKYSSQGSKVLDVGVGLGRLLDKVDDISKFGADISVGYLEVSQQKGIDVCFARAEELPYKDDYFDIVTCTDVLEHVFDLNFVVKNLLAVLKPEGKLIIRVPYNEYLKAYFNDDYPYEYVHMRTFDLFTLRALFEKVLGQRVLEWSEIPYQSEETWIPPLLLLRSINSEYAVLTKELREINELHQKIKREMQLKTLMRRVIRRLLRYIKFIRQLEIEESRFSNALQQLQVKIESVGQRFDAYMSFDETIHKLSKGDINIVVEKIK